MSLNSILVLFDDKSFLSSNFGIFCIVVLVLKKVPNGIIKKLFNSELQ